MPITVLEDTKVVPRLEKKILIAPNFTIAAVAFTSRIDGKIILIGIGDHDVCY